MEKLLSAGQLAVKLGLAKSTVLTWARAGRIPKKKLAYNVLRFRQSEVVKALVKAAPGP